MNLRTTGLLVGFLVGVALGECVGAKNVET